MEKEGEFKNGIITSGIHETCWMDSPRSQRLESLKENLETDTVIIGGGLAGLSVAYCLSERGKKVVVVEDGLIGSGESGRTTAQLVTAFDDRYYHLESLFGKEKTKLIAESHRKAIDFIENTIKKEEIECDFERLNGYLFLHLSDEKESLEKELNATLNAGLKVYELDSVPGIEEKGKCLCFPNQAQFHPI